MSKELKKDDLVLPKESYEIVGACFDVYNEIGGNHKEIYLQKALMIAFEKRGLEFKREIKIPLLFQGKIIGKYIFDFIINDLIVVEIKSSNRFKTKDFNQVKQYLANSNCQLGILVRFSEDGVTTYRILKPTVPNFVVS